MNIALILAAGSSKRTNTDIPKQFVLINNKPILLYSFLAFNEVEEMMFAGFTDEEKKALEKSYIRIGNNIYNAELAQGRIHFAGVRPDEIEKPVT
jgi:2-C-methyl-D-erythritol 4-phosphate cytidylyltransferase